MEPSKKEPKWHDDLMYNLAWQQGELTEEQKVNVGYALSKTPDIILWTLEHVPAVGDYVRAHLSNKTAMYLAGLESPAPAPQPVVLRDQPKSSSIPVAPPLSIADVAAALSDKPVSQLEQLSEEEVNVEPAKEPEVEEPKPDLQKQEAMRALLLYACDPSKTRSAFSTEGLIRVKGAKNTFVVDEIFIKRLGNDVFKAKIQTKKAMNLAEPAAKLHGVGIVIRNLMERVKDKDKPPLHFSTAGLNCSATGHFVIDEKLAKRIGEQVLDAKIETEAALKSATQALQRGSRGTRKT